MADEILDACESEIALPTYRTVPRSCMPPLFDPNDPNDETIYPYELVLRNERHPAQRTYRTVEIENDLLRVTVIPDLGGRIFQIEDRRTGAAYLHDNRCVRPVRIPPRWSFLSLGVELNFPYTHSPTGTDPVAYELVHDDEAGMAGVAVGERDRQWGLSWRAEVRLYRGYRGVVVAVRGWNDTVTRRKIQWWSNAAQPAGGDTEFVFPDEPMVAHIGEEKRGTWPVMHGIDLRYHRQYDRMIGTFHHPSTADWFGIYHHERQWGLLHLADPARLPGKKLWSFGHTGITSNWTISMTRDGGTSCEIQSGVPGLQEEYVTLGPGEDLAFVEIWQPVDDRAELDAPRRPTFASVTSALGSVKDAPRMLPALDKHATGRVWRHLVDAWRADGAARLDDLAREIGDADAGWPPTGYADIAQALEWAQTQRPSRHLWSFMRGVHACATENRDVARSILERIAGGDDRVEGWGRPGTPSEIAAALVSRIDLHLGMNEQAALARLMAAARTLRDGTLLEESDARLQELGRTDERRALLTAWPDDDARKLEVRASIEIDSGSPRAGLDLLQNTPWERPPCRHRRTNLWRAAREQLGEPTEPVPACLAEDPYEDIRG